PSKGRPLHSLCPKRQGDYESRARVPPHWSMPNSNCKRNLRYFVTTATRPAHLRKRDLRQTGEFTELRSKIRSACYDHGEMSLARSGYCKCLDEFHGGSKSSVRSCSR